jgi:hypothetical protein
MRSQAKTYSALAVAFLLLCGGTVFAVRGIKSKTSGPSPAVKQLHDQRAALYGRTDLSSSELRAERDKLREQEKKLTPEQRKQFDDVRDKAFQDHIDKFFTLSKADQEAQMDKDMARMRSMFGGGPPRSPQSSGTNSERRGPPGSERGDRGRPGGDQNLSAEQMEKEMKNYLDRTTPEQRAKMSEYFRLMRQRGPQRTGGGGPPKQ